MRIIIFIVSLLTIALNSCKWKKKELVRVESESIYVFINTVLPVMVQPDSVYRNAWLSQLRSLTDTTSGYDFTKGQIDSMITRLDTAHFYLLVQDTLDPKSFLPYQEDMRYFKEIFTQENIREYFPKLDSSYKPLVRQLLNSLPTKTIQVKHIQPYANYKIIPYSHGIALKDKIVSAGYVYFSNIAFNADSTKAVIFAAVNKGTKNLFLFSKSKEEWKLAGREVK